MVTAEPDEVAKDPKTKARLRWRKAMAMGLEEKGEEHELTPLPNSSKTATRKTGRRKSSLYLTHGKEHTVWKPKHHSKTGHPTFSDVVKEAIKRKQELQERQKSLLDRVQATQDVLKIQKSELAKISESSEKGIQEEEGVKEAKRSDEFGVPTLTSKGRWQRAVKNVTGEKKSESKKNDMKIFGLHFHDIVNQYVAAMPQSTSQSEFPPKDHSGPSALESTSVQNGGIPLQRWKRLFNEGQRLKGEREKTTEGLLHETTIPAPSDTVPEEAEITEVTSATESN